MSRLEVNVVAKKKRLSGADRRVQLMEVGRGVFASHGYEATSIEEVAQQAGVSKPIVYEHFGAKEGLYAAIVDREMDDLVARMSESISQGTPRERFEAAVLAFMTYAKEEPAGFAVLTRDSPMATARRGLTRVIDDLAQRVGDIFRSEFERAGYNPKVAPIYANALVGMVTQVGQWWAAEGKSFSIDHVSRHVAALGWMGLRHLPREPDSPGTRQGAKKRG
ncbi:TetR/AcrR family transcriptional regulator [Pyxidicoccus sp. MSG2]|uniref:TetR/AcrR family transcriptional regulator n=1 Tax=Pyxidicoccus sp. MSG2 TaxID=2996790 RepID=UPI00226DE898|nr:TetR/AcrR family transcriptional regulator [Pyxidicoccus sp. MSG2]MCY1019108.1 TetR/AcrR family transcriptional regulator [Pyxidicoccus sp. MSG2]